MEALLQDISYAYMSWESPFLLIMVTTFLFFFGSVFASFTGLVVHRLGSLSEDESLLRAITFPPSKCEDCGSRLSAIDLIPVLGWILTRGTCRQCGYKVPIKYPFIEFCVGALIASIPFVVADFSNVTVILILLVLTGVFIGWIDNVHQIIPEELTWFLFFVGLLASPVVPEIYDRALGATLCITVMWLSLAIVGIMKNKNTHAGGDVALAAVAGAWVGFGLAPWFLLVTAVFYGLHAGYQRIKGEVWVPMGPAMVAGLWLVVFGTIRNVWSAFVIF